MDVYNKIMTTNFLGPVYLTKLLSNHFIKRGKGKIVTISSVQAYIGITNRSAYASSKAAISIFMDCLRAEVKKLGITVINIFPAHVQTSFSMNALTDSGEKHEQMDLQTLKGYNPSILAAKIFNSICRKDEVVIYANWKITLAIKLRHIFPGIIFYFSDRYS
ncbi:hypothetical protein MXB_2117 [Myxobolus squamalis]|nr:hypothetical protein MXB_2117 [Myxobolus squamalis]